MAAITAAVIGAGTAIYAAKQSSKQAKQQQQLAQQGIAAADPYAPYRADAANQLNALMQDPSSIANTAEYKARQQAVARQLASQGYTGSGNALIAAADAAGESYQQSFNNLSLLAGAGVAPGGGYGQALQANQNANDNKLSAYAGIGNNLTNLISTIGAKRNPNSVPAGSTFNQPVNNTIAGPPD